MLQEPLHSSPSKSEDTDFLFECEVAQIEIESSCDHIVKEPSSPESLIDYTEKIENLTSKIDLLKVTNSIRIAFLVINLHYYCMSYPLCNVINLCWYGQESCLPDFTNLVIFSLFLATFQVYMYICISTWPLFILSLFDSLTCQVKA